MGKDKKSKKTKSTEPDPNLYSSNGEFTLPNGDVYIGEYCAHRSGLIWRQGRGTYKTLDGHLYEGEWVDDKLVENQELVIKYPDGSEYHGCIYKNKYHGPATYVLDCKMDLSGTFEGNKPVGIITLVDCDGKLWVGTAKENRATLLPENIFYLNLTEERGIGLPVNEQSLSRGFIGEEEHHEEDELPDGEWEKIIFAESKKTDKNIDPTDSKWWKNYDRFKQRQASIAEKIENEELLEEEDKEWLDEFRKYKETRQSKRQEKNVLKEKESMEAAMLNETFRSAEFVDSCPPVSIIYPSADASNLDGLRNTEEFSETNVAVGGVDGKAFDAKSQQFEEDYCEQVRSKMRAKVLFLDVVDFEDEGPGTVDFELTCDGEPENCVNFNKYINYLDCKQVHFTKEMERGKELQGQRELLLDQSAKEETSHSEKLTMEEDIADKTDDGVKKKGDKVGTGKEKPYAPEPIDEQKAFEERIKKYIEDFRKDNIVDVVKDQVKKQEVVHVHSFGVDTNSVEDIPKELFKK